MQLAGVEAVGIARFDQELLGLLGAERIRLDRQRELEGARDEASGGLGRPQRLRVAQRPAIDRVVRRKPHALIRPG
jgi:hypothetical protein